MNPVEEDRALAGEDPAYDSRRGREAMDPVTRQLVFLAAGIGLLLVVLVGGWLLSTRHASSIPVIQAAAGPVRVKPIDAGGMQAMGAQAPDAQSDGGTETLAPRPETPRPAALQAEIDAARGQPPQGDAGMLPAAPAAPVVENPQPSPQPSPEPSQEPSQESAPQPAPQPLPSPTPHAAGPAPDNPLRTEAVGRSAVQLAALDTHQAAEMEWSRLCRVHPALFSGRAPDVERIDRDGHALYRLRMRGFASAADASAFCQQARAQRVACTLADF